eukprot:g12648.t1
MIFGELGGAYSISAGTALGYRRHPQFLIPDDLDVDVVVPTSFWRGVLQFALDRGLGTGIGEKNERPSGEDVLEHKGRPAERKMWVLARIPDAFTSSSGAADEVEGDQITEKPGGATVAITYQSSVLESADAIFAATGATYVFVIHNEIVKKFAKELKQEQHFAAGELDEDRWEKGDGKHETNIMAADFGGRFFMRHKEDLGASNGRAAEAEAGVHTHHGGRWYSQIDVWAYTSDTDFWCAGGKWPDLLADANFPQTELVEFCGVPARVFSTSSANRGSGVGQGRTAVDEGDHDADATSWVKTGRENLLERHLQSCYGKDYLLRQ